MPWVDLSRREPLIIVGVDPGSRVTGFGVVGRQRGRLRAVDHGVFRVPAALGRPEERLLFLSQRIEALLDHHRPDVIALEEAFLRENVQSALRLGEVRGIALLAAAARGLPVIQYATAVAKKAVCGHGRADKETVQAMVRDQLGLQAVPEPHDAADALALALCLAFDPRLDPRFSGHAALGGR